MGSEAGGEHAMSLWLSYAGAVFAAWASMGGFCVRSDSIRSRQRWPKFSADDKQRYAFGAGLFCLLSLGLLWLAVQPSYAVILWVVLHGVLGMAIAICLPYAGPVLTRSFAVAAVLALLNLFFLFIFGAWL
jgi:hypothetical protein